MLTKSELIAKGKELGLNLKSSMSLYELQARIKEAEDGKNPPPAPKKSSSKKTGEY